MDSSESMVHRAILWQSILINLNQKLPVFLKKTQQQQKSKSFTLLETFKAFKPTHTQIVLIILSPFVGFGRATKNEEPQYFDKVI